MAKSVLGSGQPQINTPLELRLLPLLLRLLPLELRLLLEDDWDELELDPQQGQGTW